MLVALWLLPTGFSVGSVKINGKSLLELFQLDLPGVLDLKALQDPGEQRKRVTASNGGSRLGWLTFHVLGSEEDAKRLRAFPTHVIH